MQEMLGDLIVFYWLPHSDYNGPWQGALWQSCTVLNQSHRGIKNWNMCATKHILRSVQNTRACYPGLDWFCQVHHFCAPHSWQTSLGLGNIPRYSAWILIWITFARRQVISCAMKTGVWHHTFHANHWPHFSEIRWSIDANWSSITFNGVRILIVNRFHCGRTVTFNTLRPRQNGRHFSNDIFNWIFLNEDAWISINISLKFVPRGPINNIPTLVQVMAWHRSGDKPLSETRMVRLPTHICVTRPQWVKCPVHLNAQVLVISSSGSRAMGHLTKDVVRQPFPS